MLWIDGNKDGLDRVLAITNTEALNIAFLWANFMLFTDLCVSTIPCALFSVDQLKKGYDRLIPLCWTAADDNPSIILLDVLQVYTLMGCLTKNRYKKLADDTSLPIVSNFTLKTKQKK